jgi:hypothetical protein
MIDVPMSDENVRDLMSNPGRQPNGFTQVE